MSPLGWIGTIAGVIGGALLFFRPRAANAMGGAPVPGAKPAPWSGDPKAMQQAINVALDKARDEGVAGVPKPLTIDGRPGAMTCSAAEWLIKQGRASSDMQAFSLSSSCGGGAPRAPCGVHGPVASDAVREAVLDAIEKRGYPRDQGVKTIKRESGWKPQAVACMGKDKHPVAGGLMQFIPVALKSVGFQGDPAQFAALPGEQQLPYLLKFISKMPQSKLGRPGEFGLALFVPAYVDKPESTVIYDVGSLGWEQNPGLRTPGGGPITVGSVLKTTA